MAEEPAGPALHEDFLTLCAHHDFKARYTLSNQIEGAFVGRHRDFENIQGTVSCFRWIHRSFTILLDYSSHPSMLEAALYDRRDDTY